MAQGVRGWTEGGWIEHAEVRLTGFQCARDGQSKQAVHCMHALVLSSFNSPWTTHGRSVEQTTFILYAGASKEIIPSIRKRTTRFLVHQHKPSTRKHLARSHCTFELEHKQSNTCVCSETQACMPTAQVPTRQLGRGSESAESRDG
jgi:hypothetical protein